MASRDSCGHDGRVLNYGSVSGVLMLRWEEWMEVAGRKGVCMPVDKTGSSGAHGLDLKAALGA